MAKESSVIKIAITGPESSGKSFTAEYLAKTFDGWVVPEFAREYLNKLDRKYEYEDVVQIAKGQLDIEQKVPKDAAKENVDIIFFDSELINTKIWCEEKFHNVDPFILEGIQKSEFDHYLLMRPDIEWESDPQRENPKDRDRLFNLHIENLNYFQKSYTILQGGLEERLKLAQAVVKTFII